MRRSRVLALLVGVTSLGVWAQTTLDVGSGSPSDAVRFMFIQAYFRGSPPFSTLVSMPPVADVQKLGTTGLWQLFYDTAKTSGVRYALVKSTTANVSPTGSYDVFQMYPGIYAYFNSVGVNTAGYPTMDTAPCPALTGNTCTYQYFDKKYILFVYQKSTINGLNFYVREPFYTLWLSLGGFSGLGPPTSGEQSGQSSAGSSGVVQTYQNGALFNITSGLLNGRLLSVSGPIYGTFLANGGYAGFLGFPASEETALPDGRRRQTFENGSVEYLPGSDPVLRPPVKSVVVSPAVSVLSLNLGETATLKASAAGVNGAALSDRSYIWTTSDSRVASLDANGAIAIVKGTGDGTAQVRAISEGKASAPLIVLVTAPCCRIGEGAPNELIRQAFQDAVTRNKLVLRIPTQGPVRRLGDGYVQEFQSADPSSNTRYLLAKADDSAAAYLVTGPRLSRYEGLGGPGGPLGYPVADATAGGTQLFRNAALGGSSVQVVSGLILSKWALLGYETGAAGPPAGAASAFLTFSGAAGLSQPFRGGAIYLAETGPRAGKACFTSGLIMARYDSLGGAAGSLGMPVTDEFGSDNRRRQEFEGGFIDYAPGDTSAQVTERPRQPVVTVTPDYVVAGGRVRVAAGGFPAGSTLRISVTGQPDFLVAAETGAYAWEIAVPPDARSASVTVLATDARGDRKSVV
jgi:uncharacterized protein with LGFP repeats